MSDVADWSAAEARARAALGTHASTRALAQARLTPIDGSLSNYAWCAESAGTKRFVRLARVGTEDLGADLAAEARILGLVGEAGIAPPVVRCDPEQRLLVTRWIEQGVGVGIVGTAATTVAVAQALARLHALPVPRDLRAIRFDEQARRLRATLPAPTADSSLHGYAHEVYARLEERTAVPVLCHHDVHAQNMVCDEQARLWLVDWEYAGLNDPVFDLASYASQCALPEAVVRDLCAAYVRAGGVPQEGRLALARWAFDYVQWLWYLGLAATASDGHDLGEAALRSARIERSLLERASVLLRCNNRGFDQ